MAEKKGLPYKAQSGDTEDSIIKKFKVPSWQRIYDYPENADYRKKRPAQQKIQAGDVVVIPPEYVVALSTGEKMAITEVGWRFFFDAHMHIQSNNCCPLPLQWGLLTQKLHKTFFISLFVQKRTYDNRKNLNDVARGFLGELFTGRLGKIGVLSTDLVAGVCMGDLQNTDMDKEAVWSVMDEQEFKELEKRKGEEIALEKAGKEGKLQELSSQTTESFNDTFLKNVKYYYRNNYVSMFNCALLMDMSLAHFWGQWNIPVMLDWQTEAVYLNDWVAAGYKLIEEKRHDDSNHFYLAQVESNVIEPKAKQGLFHHLFAKPTRDGDFSFAQALDQYQQFVDDTGKKSPPSKNKPLLYFTDLKTDEALIKGTGSGTEKFIHLVDKIPDKGTHQAADNTTPNEIKWFEDYKLQQSLNEGAAVKYPMELLLFYHYDPRRHCTDASLSDYVIKKAKEITKKHSFYRYHLKYVSHNENNIILEPDKKMNQENFWEDILNKTLIPNNEAFNNLYFVNQDSGIYWGVKIYPRLGYDPADFTRYPQLKPLYEQCSKNDIPVIFHCSRGGMSGADYYCYAKYDPSPKGLTTEEKKRYDSLVADPSNLDYTEFWFSDTFSSPLNWENVLAEFTKLKLCFAHFGGYDMWCKVGVFEDIESLYPDNPGIFPKGEDVESDASFCERSAEREKMRATIYHTWIRKIAELAQNNENVFVDISYFYLNKNIYEPEIRLKGKPIDVMLRTAVTAHDTNPYINIKKLFAKNILYLLDKFPKLKERIIIGTDWYMIEQEGKKGVGEILWNQFEVMAMISKKSNFDAWHQFAVVNPLKYLNLAKEEKGKLVIDTDKLEKYGDVLINKYSNKIWQKDSRIKIKEDEIRCKIERRLYLTRNYPAIPKSDELKNSNNELFINKR